jgi:predicted metal-dependent phosphoesterase TrpH
VCRDLAGPSSATDFTAIVAMKVDLHVHTLYSIDGCMAPEAVVRLAEARGLGALAITDHNVIEGALAVRRIAPFPVIVGQEISTSDGEMMGLFLEEHVPRDLSGSRTISLIRQQGGLAGVPHPFDRFRRESLKEAVLEEVASELDFLEAFNARVAISSDNRRAQIFALDKGLACSAGSDAHAARELGRTYVEMEPFEDPDQFLASLTRGRISGKESPYGVHLFSLYARARRRLRRP